LIDTTISLSSQNYAGLFQLNYASLLVFCKHLLTYIIRNAKKYKEFMRQVSEKTQAIHNIDDSWFFDISAEMDTVASSNELISFFNEEQQQLNSLMIGNSLDKLIDKHNLKREYLKQLEGV
jgi:hypothetical protein